MDSVVIFLASDLFIIVGLLVLLTWHSLSKGKKEEYLTAVLVGGLLGLLLAKVFDSLYYHPRPFMVDGVKPLIEHGYDNGFPSTHTVFVTTLSTVTFFYRRQIAYIAFAISMLVGAGRVWAHVHSTVDIIGGIIAGLISGYAGFLVTKRIWQKRENKK